MRRVGRRLQPQGGDKKVSKGVDVDQGDPSSRPGINKEGKDGAESGRERRAGWGGDFNVAEGQRRRKGVLEG